MKRITLICDKCGKEFKREGRRQLDMSFSDMTRIDLCDECHADLVKWFKGESENE